MSLKRGARVVACILIASFAAWSVELLTVGVEVHSVSESRSVLSDGQTIHQPSQETVDYQPLRQALYPLIGLAVIAFGLLKDDFMPIAWIGLVLMLIFAAMLIFSFGIETLGEAAIVSLPVSIMHWQINQQRRWLAGGSIGALILIVGGVSFLYSPIGIGLLVGGTLGLFAMAFAAFSPSMMQQSG